MKKKIAFILIFLTFIAFTAYGTIPHVPTDKLTGTYVIDPEFNGDRDYVDHIEYWVFKKEGPDFGTLTVYNADGEVSSTWTWKRHGNPNDFLVRNSDGFILWHIVPRTSDNYFYFRDVMDTQFDLLFKKIDNSTDGFPEDAEY